MAEATSTRREQAHVAALMHSEPREGSVSTLHNDSRKLLKKKQSSDQHRQRIQGQYLENSNTSTDETLQKTNIRVHPREYVNNIRQFSELQGGTSQYWQMQRDEEETTMKPLEK
jgi:hypothetical protein